MRRFSYLGACVVLALLSTTQAQTPPMALAPKPLTLSGHNLPTVELEIERNSSAIPCRVQSGNVWCVSTSAEHEETVLTGYRQQLMRRGFVPAIGRTYFTDDTEVLRLSTASKSCLSVAQVSKGGGSRFAPDLNAVDHRVLLITYGPDMSCVDALIRDASTTARLSPK
jgi:hypothetical protein